MGQLSTSIAVLTDRLEIKGIPGKRNV